MKRRMLGMALMVVVSIFAVTMGCKKDDDPVVDDPVLTPREKAIKDYDDNYLGTHVNESGWTGNTVGCIPGTIPQDIRTKVIQRLNYFRRLVGLTDNVTENTDQHVACQEASLIFKAQGQLSHFPGAGWKCYTQAGYDAAGSSNIALGSGTYGENSVHTVHGISGFMEDEGANNKAVGHRSWFLMPGLFKLGVGSTNSSSCVQWKNNYNQSGTAPEFIAYPPAGYMPNKLAYPRWSFTIPTGATFTNATVTMTDENNASVQVSVINKPAHQAGSYPLKHLVWEPNINVSQIASDKKYTVTIANVTGAPKTSYTYEVIIIPVSSPARMGAPAALDERVFMSVFR